MQPVVVTETEFQRVQVPETFLEHCFKQVEPDDCRDACLAWQDWPTLLDEANARGMKCNDRLDDIMEWMSDVSIPSL